MLKVDAQKELDDLFSNCENISHYIGYTLITDARGREARIAFARVILPKDLGVPMSWPEKLVYRHAIEAGTGIQMFVICPPGDFLTPFLATEWEASYQGFVDAADTQKMFALEFVTPNKKYIAMVVDGKVEEASEANITSEDYDFLANKACAPAPEHKETPKS